MLVAESVARGEAPRAGMYHMQIRIFLSQMISEIGKLTFTFLYMISAL